MHPRNFRLGLLAVSTAAALLSACGGGNSEASYSAFSQALAAQSSTLAPSSTLQSGFASNYLDAGLTRTQLVEALTQDANAASADPSFSGFPLASLSNVSMSDCNSQNICTLTGTLTNNDADETSVPFSASVVLDNMGYRLLGDQKAS